MSEPEIAYVLVPSCSCVLSCELHIAAAEWRDLAQQISDRNVALADGNKALRETVATLRAQLAARETVGTLYQIGMHI